MLLDTYHLKMALRAQKVPRAFKKQALGHMVQSQPYWDASYAVGYPKQKKIKLDLSKFLCFVIPTEVQIKTACMLGISHG